MLAIFKKSRVIAIWLSVAIMLSWGFFATSGQAQRITPPAAPTAPDIGGAGDPSGYIAPYMPAASDIPVLDLTREGLPPRKPIKDEPKAYEYDLPLTIGEAKAIMLPYKMNRYTLVHVGLVQLREDTELQDAEGNPVTELLVQGVKTGSTELRLYDERQFLRHTFRISVSTHNVAQITKELKTLLSTVEGLQVNVIGERIVLDGEILIPRDIERIQMVLRQYPMVVDFTRLSPNTQNLYAARMEADIGKPEVTVRANQGRFILEGVVESAGEMDNILKIIQTYLPPVYEPATAVKEPQTAAIVNLLTVRPPRSAPPEKVIKLVIQYVELTKSYLRDFNFSWAPTFVDQTQAAYDIDEGWTGSISGTIENLFPKLNKAVSLNHARILNTATLLVKNGSSGNITTGLQVPFVSGQTQAGDAIIQFRDVASKTGVSARIEPGDQILVALDIGINEIVSPEGASSTNQVKTELLLGKAQSAAVGGFFKESMQRAFGRTPSTEGVTLFNMGKRRNYGHNRSQFIMFITPEILASPNEVIEASKDLMGKFRLIREI